MVLSVGTPGGNKAVSEVWVGASAGNSRVREIWIGTTLGNKIVFNSTSATVSNTVWELMYDGGGKKQEVIGWQSLFICTVFGGVGPFTYQWIADSPVFIINPTASETLALTSDAGGPIYGVVQCTVTDSSGNSIVAQL